MLKRPITRPHKVISLFIKAGILIFSFFYIAYKLKTAHAEGLGTSLQKADVPLLLLVSALMFLNWGLEALKWQWLIAPLERITFGTALKSVFAGVTVSIFMPNRVGEFAGRIFFLEKADKVEATLRNFIGATLQFFVTFFAGAAALYLFVQGQDTAYYSSKIALAIQLTMVVLVLLIAGLYLLKRLQTKFSATVQSRIKALTNLSALQLTGLFLLSVLRYGVFLFQYYFVLLAFGVDVNVGISVIIIAATFLVTSLIPSFAFTEVVTRGAVASTFFSYVTPDTSPVVAASAMVWIINLAVPALIGSVFTWQLKFFKR